MTVTDLEIGSDRHAPVVKGGGRSRRRARLLPGGLRWILPAFAISVGLIYYSIIYSGYLSFFSWPGGRALMTPVGFGNYISALADPVLWTSLRNTIIYFVVVFIVQVAGGTLFAAAMHSKIRFANLYKVLVVIPVVVAPATLAPAHVEVWQSDGTVNSILGFFGLSALQQPWIGQSTTSLLVVTLVGCWGAIGYGFILIYAGMAQIDPELIEAGRLDGAGNFRVLFSIVLPSLRPIIVSLAILNFITALKLFDSPWLITQGGPAHSSEFLGTMIYAETASSDRNLGYASALSILVLIIAIAVSVFMQLRGRERLTRTKPRRKEAADV
ncbi:sugar ABC transporter permease [Leifsonia sp. 1010]|uniref:carbohydrate ABC transporter permease n=1 Tax=Leifsonia sp. 1010 TaxID=2817769 RepID=UPI0028611783|nr:sugar ABC transporter permease [Leifsonia sp. 1010]MDR6611795.1 ABC-type sugar transport system permease subunit [Leifsonia sp. 1010]